MRKVIALLLTGCLTTIACQREEAGSDEESAAANAPAENQAAKKNEATNAQETREESATSDPDKGDKKDAMETAKDAADTLKQMKTDPNLKQLLSKAHGVFIVPAYGRAAAGVGARGGEGTLLVQRDGKWTGPAFYDLGGLSLGAQFGGEGGEIAMILTSQQAVDAFQQDNNFSINADAKLTVVDYSSLAENKLGDKSDVIFWSDTEGAFAGVALSATDISWDDEENPAYYGKTVGARDIISGKVTGPEGPLQRELSGV